MIVLEEKEKKKEEEKKEEWKTPEERRNAFREAGDNLTRSLSYFSARKCKLWDFLVLCFLFMSLPVMTLFGQLLEDKSVKSSMKWEEALKLIQATVFTYFTEVKTWQFPWSDKVRVGNGQSLEWFGTRMCTDCAPVYTIYLEIHLVLG